MESNGKIVLIGGETLVDTGTLKETGHFTFTSLYTMKTCFRNSQSCTSDKRENEGVVVVRYYRVSDRRDSRFQGFTPTRSYMESLWVLFVHDTHFLIGTIQFGDSKSKERK